MTSTGYCWRSEEAGEEAEEEQAAAVAHPLLLLLLRLRLLQWCRVQRQAQKRRGR